MFSTAHSTPLLTGRGEARARETWRDAASLVAIRWQVFLEAEPQTRAWAFASYVVALDAEEAAAADLEGFRIAALGVRSQVPDGLAPASHRP